FSNTFDIDADFVTSSYSDQRNLARMGEIELKRLTGKLPGQFRLARRTRIEINGCRVNAQIRGQD
ncbi:MAG TPA: hypothetical protein VGA09_23555, partial [Candidatus Binatia bacterium]